MQEQWRVQYTHIRTNTPRYRTYNESLGVVKQIILNSVKKGLQFVSLTDMNNVYGKRIINIKDL